jgi:hypothetical protein
MWSVVFAVAAADVGQFVAVGLSVHRVREVLSMRRGVHRPPTARSYAPLNAITPILIVI